MTKKPFYITTTLPYVNAEPHIGFAMELVRADIIARAKKLSGHEVFLNTGTDEHGLKIQQVAKRQGIEPQVYVDQASTKFKDILGPLGIATDEAGINFNFIRTTDPDHIKSAQAFWTLVYENGRKHQSGPFIYKKNYSVKYCVGCELEKTESELVNGRCPLHPLQELELIEEENYFFRFSAFQKSLLDLYDCKPPYDKLPNGDTREPLVVPDFRFNEIKAFVSRGLEDFSVSRLASKMPWGVPVPGDESQVMYVWFDALVNYISAAGWPDRSADFKKWCEESGGMVQYCGKDNLRQQSAMWQAMQMAAGLPPSQTIVIDGFITGEGGIKMSKSLGNTIDPADIVKEYGTDALRYYVSRELSSFEDSPFTMEKFKEAYNANLANGIGNLTSRIMKMAEANLKGVSVSALEPPSDYLSAIGRYDIKEATDIVWYKISELDELIQKEQPFTKVKNTDTKAAALKLIDQLVKRLAEIAILLKPFLPATSVTILECISNNKVPITPLFARK